MPESKSVLCIGAVHYDCIAECEKPLQLATSNPVRSHRTPGGVAHNIARNLNVLSRSVGMCSLIGEDGDDLKRYLAETGIDNELIGKSHDLPTANYTAVLDPGGELAFGLADMAIYDQLNVPHMTIMLKEMYKWPVWLIDANLPTESLDYLARQKTDQIICAAPVSTRKAQRWDTAMYGVDIWVGNAMEAAEMTGLPVATSTQVFTAATALTERGPDLVVVTLGPEGAILKAGKRAGHWVPPETTVVNVNGAGDSFYAGFLDAVLRGESPEKAMNQAIAVSSLTTECSDPVRSDLNLDLVKERQKLVPQFQSI